MSFSIPWKIFFFALVLTGCGSFQKKTQNDAEKAMIADGAVRQSRLRETRVLNDKEYETVSDRMGWVRSDARGLPPPPSTAELERKVKAAEKGSP